MGSLMDSAEEGRLEKASLEKLEAEAEMKSFGIVTLWLLWAEVVFKVESLPSRRFSLPGVEEHCSNGHIL